jgi:hypothetical protein
MSHARSIQLIAVAGLVLCIVGGGVLGAQVRQQRRELKLGPRRDLNEKLPPYLVVANTMSGPFRGLMIDMMWYRLEEMKQQGKYHEANQLSRWIVMLQPRFPKVWDFMAWNMAYNISVKTDTPQERWDWVSKGINLLRDEGIPLNPNSVGLYKQLSWIFSHKVGQMSDDMHWYYRAELAREWQELLGTPTEGATTEQALAAYRRIAEAPDTLEQVVAKHPGVAKLLAQCLATSNEYKPGVALLRAIGRIQMCTAGRGPDIAGAQWMAQRGLFDPELAAVVSDPQHAGALDALLAHLRKRALIDTYHMKPHFMLALMEDDKSDPHDPYYAPLDFRHPCAHAVYWAALGVERAVEVWKLNKDIDLVNTDRQVVHGLQELMRSGRIIYDPIQHSVQMLPDVQFVEAYNRAVIEASLRVMRTQDLSAGVLSTFEAGHENFLQMAMTYEFLYGDQQKAQKYYREAAQQYGSKPHNVRDRTYQQPIDELVMHWLAEDMSLAAGTQWIDAMLQRAFLEGLANNDGEVYNRYMTLAKLAYDKVQSKAMPDARTQQQRQGLRPFPEVVANTFYSMLLSPRISVVRRSRAWHGTPDFFRRMVYDDAAPTLHAHAKSFGLDPDRAFPQPPGMEQFRQQRAKALEEQKQNGPDATIERK